MGAAKAAAQGAQERGSPPAKNPVFNYALITGKGLPKTKSKSWREWSALRSEIDTTSVREELVPSPPVMFTRERYGHVIVVPFPGSLRKDLVLKAIRSTLRYFNRMDLNLPSRIALMYHDKAEMEADCQGHLSVGGFELPLVKACYSAGKRLQIRTDYVSFGSIEECQEALRKTFKPFGEIVHFHWHQLKDTSRTVLTGSLDFVLDLPADTTRDTMIPQVAVVMGSNTLFSWGKSAFCYRCGREDHTKATCPKPFNYSLKEDLAFSAPIMAKVCADESAPPRAPLAKPHSASKKVTLTPVSPTSVQKGTSGEWTTVSPSKSAMKRLMKVKRDAAYRQLKDDSSSSESDSGRQRDSKKSKSEPVSKTTTTSLPSPATVDKPVTRALTPEEEEEEKLVRNKHQLVQTPTLISITENTVESLVTEETPVVKSEPTATLEPSHVVEIEDVQQEENEVQADKGKEVVREDGAAQEQECREGMDADSWSEEEKEFLIEQMCSGMEVEVDTPADELFLRAKEAFLMASPEVLRAFKEARLAKRKAKKMTLKNKVDGKVSAAITGGSRAGTRTSKRH